MECVYQPNPTFYELKSYKTCTLDGSHRPGTTEIVQAIKSVEEKIEDSKEMKVCDQTMYL